MNYRWLGLILFILAITACDHPITPNEKTSIALPSHSITSPTTTLTPGALSTPAPLTVATPAIVVESSQIPPTPTESPLIVSLPTEQVRIFRPGPNSHVTQPFQVAGWAGPSFRDRVTLRLLGEDGRVLAEGTTWLHVLEGMAHAGRFYGEIPFQIPHVAEAGRLEIRVYSYRDGQLSHLRTVDLTLLSVGSPLIQPAMDGPEKLAIFSPRDEAEIEGGHVFVSGAGWVDSELPLTVEVLDQFGEVLGSAQIHLDAPEVGQTGTFQVDVAYAVPFPQWGRIAISEHSAGIPGFIHYASVEVWLKP